MISLPDPLTLTESAKANVRLMFIAKHARWEGGLHHEDGSHAIYHQEIRAILEGFGFDLTIGDRYAGLFEKPEVDFVFPLLNRGGFLNSEMLLPLLCTRHGIPFLGASPILRGVADDKHLTKMIAVSRGIPCNPWAVYRRWQPLDEGLLPRADRYVIKPNASSASWGVSSASDWKGIREAIEALHEEGHDAVVEPFISGDDIEVSVIMREGRTLVLPTMTVVQEDPDELRTYQEKRNLTDQQAYAIQEFTDAGKAAEVEGYAHEMMREFIPYDYGRFEMRMNRQTGEVRFLEVNLNCNLWSKKTISMAAGLGGWRHEQVIEHILAESLSRHGLM